MQIIASIAQSDDLLTCYLWSDHKLNNTTHARLKVKTPEDTLLQRVIRQAKFLTAHHDGGDVLRIVSVQVKFKGHHLAVVSLKLALHHPIHLIGQLCTQRNGVRQSKIEGETESKTKSCYRCSVIPLWYVAVSELSSSAVYFLCACWDLCCSSLISPHSRHSNLTSHRRCNC